MTPPAPLLPFLHAKGSLTARLEAAANRPLTVKITHERHRALNFTEKKRLGLPVGRQILAWERQVLLFGAGDKVSNDRAWVQAVSLFPLPSLQGGAKRLRHLKNTPIGYVLFKKNKRLPHTRHFYCQQGQFGRQTVYTWQGHQLLIQELFLPEFERFLNQT